MSNNKNNFCVRFCVIVTIFSQVVGCFLEEIQLLLRINDTKFDQTTIGLGIVVNLIGFGNGLLLLFGSILWLPKLVLAHLAISCSVTIPSAIYILVEIFTSGLSVKVLIGTFFGYLLVLALAGGFLYAIYLYYKEIQADYDQGDRTELVVNECV